MTLLQFGENLSDRRAADAVRSRTDWKYLLGPSLKDPGFDASVLSEFRARLVKGGAESLLFDRRLVLCREQGFPAQHGRQRTDTTHVLGAVRTLTRLACAIGTLRTALDALAIAAPGVTLVGPPPADNQWQARPEGAFAVEQFDPDWDRQIATCPAGQTSESWSPDTNGGHDNVRIRFSLT